MKVKAKNSAGVMIGILVSVCVLVFFAGCNRRQKGEDGQIVVAAVLKTTVSPFWQTVVSGLKDGAAEHNVKLIGPLGPPTEDAVEEQINMIQSVISQKPDVLVLAPSQPPATVKALRQVKAAGIKIILIDTPMPDNFEDYETFIGTTNFTAGADAAKIIIQSGIPQGSNTVILEGAPGNPTMTQRADGAEKTFRDAGFNIAARQPAYSDKERAFTVMQNIMQTTPDIAAVFSANDDQALGAYRAISQAGKTAVVIGVDGTRDALNSILRGELHGSMGQNSYQMGVLAVENAVKLMQGAAVDKRIDSGTTVLTKENAQKQIEFLDKIGG
ncbi:MAG: sugar ABC transporter substrate-binding protein [Treponema sp.]|jgi:ribose transport system substrate-binding protein|nr:sugar ABC transporter substrate-binding protein [Treponema sp.]